MMDQKHTSKVSPNVGRETLISNVQNFKLANTLLLQKSTGLPKQTIKALLLLAMELHKSNSLISTMKKVTIKTQ